MSLPIPNILTGPFLRIVLQQATIENVAKGQLSCLEVVVWFKHHNVVASCVYVTLAM